MQKRSLEALGRPTLAEFKNTTRHPVVLVLDNVRSGLNVGSMFRTADAFALEALWLCGITAQPPHREILKTALGSTESVPWHYAATTLEAVQKLRASGYHVYAVEQTSEPIWLHEMALETTKKYAFVLGNEVDGVADEVLAACDGAVEIPQFGTKHSLNVAVAAGLVAWEAVRNLSV